ncbi:MAG: Maf family protein [Lachnospiraceae bacterium]|nr:Maf family protein [Lachnospiraceae bacterium]
MRVILGSASPRRREILEQAGIEFEIITSDLEEKITSRFPWEVVLELSRMKALDVYSKAGEKYNNDNDLLVIGADTIVALDGKIFGKPEDEEAAYEMLKALSGRVHEVYTGVTVITQDMDLSFASCTEVSVYELEREEILKYIATKEPMDKAGAYAIQGGFAKYIKEIKGEYNNVVGFPIAAMIYELKKAGIVL